MRLLVLSDLHREFWRDRPDGLRFNTSISQPDVVVLAGDIETGGRAPKWAAEAFPGLPVIYVAGNHEFYGDTLEDGEKELREACEPYPNVHYLNCNEFVHDGVRFLGCTLWTDYFLFGDGPRWRAMLESAEVLSDYSRIRVKLHKYRKLHPSDTVRLHGTQRDWLKKKLAEPFAGKTAIITHMAPSMRSVAPRFADDLTSAAFASHLDPLVEQADVWIHGHMHDSFSYGIGKCRVVCNPAGYMSQSGKLENEQFDPNFIVNL